MGYGDEILAAGQAQRHFDLTGQKSVIVDRRDRPRWHSIWDGNPVIFPEASNVVDARYNRILNAPGARPYIVYPFTAETGWTFNRAFRAREHIAKIYFTNEEAQIAATWSTFRPFVLFDPWSKHENLRWPLDHWRRLIRLLPEIKFVQQEYVGGPTTLAGAVGVITPSFRAACAVMAGASVYIRGESGMCHAAAALGVPTVTIWGNCMDWDVLGDYPLQTGVGISPDPPCGRWLPCPHCAATMAAISPEMVASALREALSRAVGHSPG